MREALYWLLMESVELSCNGACIDEVPPDLLLPQGPPDKYDVFGEPEIIPRVGGEYQAEIPCLISKDDYLFLQRDPTDEEALVGGVRGFIMGLPISIMWISAGSQNVKHEGSEVIRADDSCTKRASVRSETFKGPNLGGDNNYLSVKVETEDIKLDHPLGKLTSQEEVRIKLGKINKKEGCFPVPGSLKNGLSNEEEASFILALYIFGKNLVQVRKFMENKELGDILSHYYGKFYGSSKYRRWSECRKMKSRRCIIGQKIFTGLRQQELLSRLLPQVSVESQSRLLEVSRAFGEGKFSLEEYVFDLKATVGLKSLVEAIGIGQGKQDLTGLVMEPAKSNQAIPTCPDIPVGKACSALTTAQIVNFLTGGFRLSKARSNDLFWEAVWPRLLARGWHSEQPENGFGSKHALVFLVPGVKKFSKRRLVKGNHYFDSVSDVLSKVASDPGLLDLELGEGYGDKKGDGWINVSKLEEEEEDSADEERHCYLKPRTPSRSTDGMKFTVVDTSMASGLPCKLRELRILPPETSAPSFRGLNEDDDENVCEELMNRSSSADSLNFSMDETDISKPMKPCSDKRVYSGKKDSENVASSWGSANTSMDSHAMPKMHGDQKIMSKSNQLGKAAKCEPKARVKPKSKNSITSNESKLQKSPVCDRSETSCNVVNILAHSRFKQEESSSCSSNPNSTEKMHLMVDPSAEMFAFNDSAPKSSCLPLSSECDAGSSYSGFSLSQDSLQPGRALIDLNLPVQPDAEFSDTGITANSQNGLNAINTTSSFVPNPEQQPLDTNSRRQSTRNRPLTTKALEALAFGLWDMKKKRKTRDEFSGDMLPRPSRRATVRAHTAEEKTSEFPSSRLEQKREDVNGGNMADDIQVLFNKQWPK